MGIMSNRSSTSDPSSVGTVIAPIVGDCPSVVINSVNAYPSSHDGDKEEMEDCGHSAQSGEWIPDPVLYYHNGSLLIRDENNNNDGCDLFGRNIYNIRQMYTSNDTEPFECL